jgi:hypothetical protein
VRRFRVWSWNLAPDPFLGVVVTEKVTLLGIIIDGPQWRQPRGRFPPSVTGYLLHSSAVSLTEV